MAIGENLKKYAIAKTLEWTVGYLQKDPEKNVKRALDVLLKA